MSSESLEQQKFIEWCKLSKCKYHNLDRIFAIPNGGYRAAREAAKLKREGVTSGVPDLCLPVPRHGYHGLYIEMKHGKGKPSANQKEWINYLNEVGYKAVLAWEFEGAVKVIEDYYRGVL